MSLMIMDITHPLTSLLTAFFIPSQGQISHVLPLVIMGTLSVLGGITALFLPETLWRHLPNTLEESEEFGSNFDICSCPQKRFPEKIFIHIRFRLSPNAPTASGFTIHGHHGFAHTPLSPTGVSQLKGGYGFAALDECSPWPCLTRPFRKDCPMPAGYLYLFDHAPVRPYKHPSHLIIEFGLYFQTWFG